MMLLTFDQNAGKGCKRIANKGTHEFFNLVQVAWLTTNFEQLTREVQQQLSVSQALWHHTMEKDIRTAEQLV